MEKGIKITITTIGIIADVIGICQIFKNRNINVNYSETKGIGVSLP